jgi:hypothetical protein
MADTLAYLYGASRGATTLSRMGVFVTLSIMTLSTTVSSAAMLTIAFFIVMLNVILLSVVVPFIDEKSVL